MATQRPSLTNLVGAILRLDGHEVRRVICREFDFSFGDISVGVELRDGRSFGFSIAEEALVCCSTDRAIVELVRALVRAHAPLNRADQRDWYEFALVSLGPTDDLGRPVEASP